LSLTQRLGKMGRFEVDSIDLISQKVMMVKVEKQVKEIIVCKTFHKVK